MPRAEERRGFPAGKRAVAGLVGQSSAEISQAPIEIFKTGSIYAGGNSLTVAGTVNGAACEITVDTGSNISIVRPDILSGVDQDLIEPVNSCLRTVTGERAPIHGKGQLQLGIGSLLVPQELWVADIHDDCILGLDFLQSHKCLVNLKDGALTIGGEEIPLKKQPATAEPTCCKVVLAEHVQLPPRSEMVIPVKMEGAKADYQWGLLEQSTAPTRVDDVLVARTLVNIQKEPVPLRVVNLSRHQRMIKKGTELACCETVTSVHAAGANLCEQLAGDVNKTQVEEKLPPHLKELYDRSVTGLAESECQEVHKLLCEFSDIFSTGPRDLGCTDLVQHRIHTGEAAPIRQQPRRLPLCKREEAERAIKEMKELGVIEPSTSPWSSPIVLVGKKDGSTRFCVDYRKLNDVTHKDSYPLPRIDDTIEALAGAEWFSTLDLKSGYWQVPLDDAAKEKTAFSTGNGLWQFKVMPFGLCNAPATFERLMEQVLLGLPASIALVYLDDIVVPGHTLPHQINNLRQVFECMRKAKLKLSPKKCTLFKREVKYLGHTVSGKGIAPDPGKIEAVAQWPRPTTASEIKSFLGLCSYYRRFVPLFAEIAHPLHQLATVVPFKWTEEAEEAFQKLKLALTNPPVLAYPDPSSSFILDTDASAAGIGAVLSQEHPTDKQERVVAYFSRALTTAERHYCVTRKELLAMVKSIEHFHTYLYGRNFRLRTDHAALQWLLHFRHPEGQVARWIQSLQQYDFTVQHRPGSKHGNADALSRRPCLTEACKYCDRLESQEQRNMQDQTNNLSTPQVATLSLSHPDSTNSKSAQELRQAQLGDPDIKPVLEWLEKCTNKPTWEEIAPHSSNTKTYCAQWQSLRVFEGVLYRLWETPSGDDVVKQLILPKSLRQGVLQQLHDARTAGHLGIAKTLGRVRQRFYWVQCRKDVQEWCRNCDLCAQKRGPQKKIKAPMGKYNVGSPMERIAIDVLGPLPLTESGNKYVVVIADYFTKWVEALPIPNQEASTIAELLVKEVICRFGVPHLIHSDQGRNFESALFAEMCQLLGIKKTRTTPYHPASDGMVERFNRTLEMQLSKFADHNQKDWDLHIPFLVMAYRSADHDSTGCSPSKMMLGREIKLPVDLIFGRPEEEPHQGASDYAHALQERFERVHNFAREHLDTMTSRMKQKHDLQMESPPLQEGDAVWLHNPQRKKGLTPKLQRPWQGPYTVTKKINDLVYRIQLGPKAKPKVVHRNRLWKYSGSSAPDWYLQEKSTSESVDNQNVNSGTHVQTEPELNPETPELRRSNRTRRPPVRYRTNLY